MPSDTEATETINWEQQYNYNRAMRARNRWHLYKMLVLNRTLCKYRCKPKKKHGLLAQTLLGIANIEMDLCKRSSTNKLEINLQEEILLEDNKQEESLSEQNMEEQNVSEENNQEENWNIHDDHF